MDNINLIKSILNKELESKDLNNEKILKLSRKLDKLILKYYNANGDSKIEIDKISE